jgi:hypothetical protein
MARSMQSRKRCGRDERRRRASHACCALGLALGALAAGCNAAGTHAGVLVGVYAVRGVLSENTCGQTGLPAANPLVFDVEIREDDGIGYWQPSKASSNTGSFNASGGFRFATSQTKILSMGPANPVLQPSNFTSQTPDFDLQQTTCAVSMVETITGGVRRRDAADGGGIMQIELAADAAVSDSSADLVGEDLIDVAPTAGSDCNADLTAFGGSYLALPCHARYALTGTLMLPTGHALTAQSGVSAGSSAAVITAGSSAAAGAAAAAAGGSSH